MESPFAQHLQTNYIPPGAEVSQIRAYLVPHTEELTRLDSLIHALCQKRTALASYIESHKALVSPARRLPRDIVEQIFIACLPANHNAVMSAREAPLLLETVCRGWRGISRSTPALWTSLH
ncbi:hypothetical protein C8R43DRAFT_856842, partial [Mycena crocata]